jgi:hypothetical protein
MDMGNHTAGDLINLYAEKFLSEISDRIKEVVLSSNPYPPGTRIQCTDMASVYYGQQGVVTGLGKGDAIMRPGLGWYVRFDSQQEDANPVYCPWGLDRIRD